MILKNGKLSTSNDFIKAWSRDRLLSIIKNATKHRSGTAFDMKRHKIKLFTILRHPQERVCSVYKFLNIYGHHVLQTKTSANLLISCEER